MAISRNEQKELRLAILAGLANSWKHGTIFEGRYEVTRIVSHESFLQIWMRPLGDTGPSTCFTVRITGE